MAYSLATRRRAGHRLAAEAWVSQREYAWRHRWVIAGLLLACIVGTALIVALWPWAVAGPIVGGVTVLFVGIVAWVTTSYDGARYKREGASGERLTSDVFRRRSMRRRGWRIIDQIPFDKSFGDVDHVACGPAGVLAVETRWTGFRWRIESGELVGPLNTRDPLNGSLTGARKIRSFLRSAKVDADVVPVLAVWGPGARSLPDQPEWVGSVLVMSGGVLEAARARLPELTNTSVDQETVERICSALGAYLEAYEPD